MTLRHVAAAVIAVGALVTTSAPASATCYIANIDICHKPTDPITDPITDPVVYTVLHTVYGTLCIVDQAYCA